MTLVADVTRLTEQLAAERVAREQAEKSTREAFVAGAAWWEHHQSGATMWPSDRRLAEDAAEQQFPFAPWPHMQELAAERNARQQAEAERDRLRAALGLARPCLLRGDMKENIAALNAVDAALRGTEAP